MPIITYTWRRFQEVIDAIAGGRNDAEKMITKQVKLEEVVEEEFKTLVADRASHCKIMVRAA